MGIIFVFSAPSGAGKTTLCQEMMKRCEGLMRSVSHTTRLPRSEEVHGRDYYFISVEEFSEKIKQAFFLEWAVVHGHFYGTSKENLLEAERLGMDLVLVIDVQGAEKLQNMHLDAVYTFISAPSIRVLENRLKDRGSDSDEEVRVRLMNALSEMEKAKVYDYILMNREIEETLTRMISIVMAERCKTRRFFSTGGYKELTY